MTTKQQLINELAFRMDTRSRLLAYVRNLTQAVKGRTTGQQLYCFIENLDDKGGVTERKLFPSKSYVHNWLGIIAKQLNSDNVVDLQDTLNVTRTLGLPSSASGANLDIKNAVGGVSTHGVVLGSANTPAVNANDYKLGTQIAHGTGAGQLTYGAQSSGLASNNGTRTSITVSRPFTNNSAGSITPLEMGVYVSGWSASTRYAFGAIRDIIPSPPAIGVGITKNYGYVLFTDI